MPRASVFTEREPNSLEAEQAVIGSILVDNTNLHHAMTRLGPEDFYYPNHQIIYESILRIQDKQHPIDIISLSADLTDRNLLEKIGGVLVLSNLADYISVHNAEYYVQIVAEKAQVRKLIRSFRDLQGACYEEDAEPDEIISLAAKRLQEVRDDSNQQSFMTVGRVIFDRMNELQKLAGEKKQPVQQSGFRGLDQKIGGLRKGALLIIAARPGMGKSALAFNIAQNVATGYNVPTAIFSLEMSKEEVSTRFLSTYATISSSKINSADLSQEEWSILGDKSAELYETPIYINDRSNITAQEMLASCRELKLKEPGLGLIIVDYLQLMSSDRRRQDNRQQEISDISRNLKIMARELDCPVIALSQLSRACEGRPDKRPLLSDLRDSGAIEQDADVVLFLYREDYYKDKDEQDQNISSHEAELIVAKNRQGATGTVLIGWRPEFTLFYDLSTEREGLEPPPF